MKTAYNFFAPPLKSSLYWKFLSSLGKDLIASINLYLNSQTPLQFTFVFFSAWGNPDVFWWIPRSDSSWFFHPLPVSPALFCTSLLKNNSGIGWLWRYLKRLLELQGKAGLRTAVWRPHLHLSSLLPSLNTQMLAMVEAGAWWIMMLKCRGGGA